MKHKFVMESNMKKLGFIILLSALTASAFGQQFLWQTVSKDSVDVKYVPLNNVTREVLTFYDQYKFYYDFSGYSKDRFIREIDYGFEDWKWLNNIKELTVFALRSNTGQGSVVLVMCISNDNVNLIVFSNNAIDGNFNFQMTYSYSSSEKEKFISWFKTLLN